MYRILIVDDEKSIRTTLSAFLVGAGYEVEVAPDVEEAQEILRRGKTDIVISDIVMPHASGVALLKQISETSPHVKTIIITGEPTMETAVEAVRKGANDYLIKPVGKEAILNSVRKVAQLKQLEDEKARLQKENVKYQQNLESMVAERTSQLEKALDSLKKAQKTLIQQERMNALGQMASGIAHDFNNALMPIVGFSEMLLSNPDSLDNREDTLHMISMIKSCGDDARIIVKRLGLLYKRDEAGYRQLQLSELLDGIIELTAPKWKEEMRSKGITINIDTDFEEVPLINGHPTELREVFTNLIFNAVDAIHKNGTITLRLMMESENEVCVEVIDTGVGMDSETSSRCIEPFFTSKGEHGTGLGLPLVYGIVQRHGGSLKIDSEVGVGTKISMLLPVGSGSEEPEDEETSEVKTLSPLRILVIDDDSRTRAILAKMLSADGHKVDMADDGLKGIACVHSAEYDLVCVDRAMPVMSGDEVAAEMAKIKPGLPIILVTGFSDIAKKEGQCPEHFAAIVDKPVRRKELQRVIADVVSARSRNQ